MPDLSLKGSHEYWKNYADPMIYRTVSFMEAVEKWTVDGNEAVEAAMGRLGGSLDGITRFELNKEDLYVEIAAQLHMSRALGLLQAIDSTHPGSASRVLMHAENKSQSNQDVAGLFLRRNIVFERLRLLGRVFSPDRFNLLTKALEGDDEEM